MPESLWLSPRDRRSIQGSHPDARDVPQAVIGSMPTEEAPSAAMHGSGRMGIRREQPSCRKRENLRDGVRYLRQRHRRHLRWDGENRSRASQDADDWRRAVLAVGTAASAAMHAGGHFGGEAHLDHHVVGMAHRQADPQGQEDPKKQLEHRSKPAGHDSEDDSKIPSAARGHRICGTVILAGPEPTPLPGNAACSWCPPWRHRHVRWHMGAAGSAGFGTAAHQCRRRLFACADPQRRRRDPRFLRWCGARTGRIPNPVSAPGLSSGRI